MKILKTLILLTALAFTGNMLAQDYCMTSPIGYGKNATGGAGGSVITVTNASDLETALKSSGAKIILISGNVRVDYLSVEVHDKTIIGLPGSTLYTDDQTAGASGILYIKNSDNVIMRNLTFIGPGAYDSDGRDCLCFDNCQNMWVDHCDFQDGMDGNFDNKDLTDNITISWCKFGYNKPPKAGGSGGTDDHRFSNLVGSSSSDKPSDGLYSMTWQYCYWAEGCVERMTRARNADLHFLNCYWNSSVAKVNLGLEKCKAYVENSTFTASTSVIYDSYGDPNYVTFDGCTGSVPSNVNGGTSKPSYSYTAVDANTAKNAILSSCGAGATLLVNSTTGEVSTSCSATTPTLLLTSASTTSSQSVQASSAISNITYVYGGTATTATATGLPNGVNPSLSGSTLTISGTPTVAGTYNYTVTATDGSTNTSLTGTITVTNGPLATPTSITANAATTSVTLNWSAVTNATSYTVNFCEPGSGTATGKTWDFTGDWTIDASDADANLVLDTKTYRFNYAPATNNEAVTFANGTAVPDLEGLKFTAGADTKLRLGFGDGGKVLYLNGSGIEISIPANSGEKVTIVGPAGNSTVADRGYTISGGTLNTSESVNVDASGIMNVAGEVGTWVIDATSSTVTLTTVTGGMNIQTITVGDGGSTASCSESTVTSNTFTATGLTPGETYTYQVKANASNYPSSDYSTQETVTTPTSSTPVDGTYSLSSGSNSQSIVTGDAITTTEYAYTGTFSGMTWTGTSDASTAPAGITVTTSASTITIEGTPTTAGSYGYSFYLAGISGGINSATENGSISVADPVSLSTPSSISASATENSVTVNWGAVSNASGYLINLCSGAAGTSKTFNFNNESATSYTTNTTLTNGLDIISAGKAVAIKSGSGTYGGIDITQYASLTGSGSITDCALSITTDGAGTLTLYSNAATKSRYLVVNDGTDELVSGGTSSNEFDVTIPSAGTYYIYSASSGIDVYLVKFASESSSSCTEYPITNGTATSYTINGLTNGVTYTYQIKATSTNAAYSDGAYSTTQTITTGTTTGCNSASVDLTLVQTNNELSVNGVDVEEVAIYTITGNKVESVKDSSINISSLYSGMYIVIIKTTDGKVASKKIIKK